MTKEFNRTLGDYMLAEVHLDYVVGAGGEIERRYDAAREAFIACPATDAAGVFAKLDAVHKEVRDDERFDHFVRELETCRRESIEPGTDLAHVADAITVLARRMEREGLNAPWLRFLKAATADARALASLVEA